jgi:glycosyltransferase involved in cell wall biosynthesis
MSAPATVSVILPVYNGERFLARTIESVLAQTYAAAELVIVNDGSTDGSARVIDAYRASGRLTVIEQANQGVASARNAALAASNGQLIALIDQDDTWLPDKLERQVAYMAAHPDIGLLHARIECVDSHDRAMSCEGWIYVDDYEGMCADRLLAGNGLVPLTVMVRRTCLDDVGGFDQAFAPADDWHLWLRIAVRYPLGMLDAVVGRYRVHDANESKNVLKMMMAAIRVMEWFQATYPAEARRASAPAVDGRLLSFYEKASELLSADGRVAEAATMAERARGLERRSLWQHGRLPTRQRRLVRWYWSRLRSLVSPHGR